MAEPVPPYRYNVLIVDDDDAWANLAALYVSEITDRARVDFVDSRDKAVAALSKRVYHFASIDQNIPDTKGEVVRAENGLALCAALGEAAPLTQRAIYTSFGRTQYAHQAGSLDGTKYYEKALEETADSVSLADYFSDIIPKTLDGHLIWALQRARSVLPQAFGAACATLAEQIPLAAHERESSAILADQLNWLWEMTVWLNWCRACALARAAGQSALLRRSPTSRSAEYAVKTVGALWRELGPAGWMKGWRKYVTAPPQGGVATRYGDLFLDTSDRLRRFRNEGAHHARISVSRSDLIFLSPDLQRWIDGLAFFADHPLMLSPRVHPTDRTLLQFTKLAGSAPWGQASIASNADLPSEADRRRHVFARHTGPDGDVLVDMFPFVSMVDRPGHPPEPALLVPGAKRPRRISLVDGGDVSSSLTLEEAEAIRACFHNQWRL